MEIEKFLKSRKYKAKVDGKEQEVDFDELVRGYGHMSAANARMRDAAEARKRAEAAEAREKAILERIGSWKTKPESIFEMAEKLGVDVDTLAHERALKKMQYEMMSDEERAQYERDRKLERYEAREREEAEAQRKREIEQMRQQATTQLETDILSYLEKAGGKVSPTMVGRALDEIINAMNAGEDMTIEEAFNRANGWYKKQSGSIFQEQLRELLSKGEIPKELAEAVRKADMAALRKSPPKREISPESKKQTKSSAIGLDDFFGDLEKRYKK